MFSGYLQAGLYSGLNGTHGLSGWRWLFLIDGCMGVPVAIAGVFLLPDLPENARAFYPKTHHIEVAQRRMREVGRASRKKLGWDSWKRIFGRWHVFFLTMVYIVFINAVSLHEYLKTLTIDSRGIPSTNAYLDPNPLSPSLLPLALLDEPL